MKTAGLDWIDRLLGAVFGAVRGGVIVLAVVMLAGLTSLPRQPVWKNAVLAPPLEAGALVVAGHLPAAIRDRIRYR